MKKDSVVFLCALQYVSFSGRVIAPRAMRNIGKDDIECLKEEVNDPKNKSVPSSLTRLITEKLANETLKTIYGQIIKLRAWGMYFEIAKTDNRHLSVLRKMSKKAVDDIAKGDYEKFGEEFSAIWTYILKVLKKNLVKFGVKEAAEIVVPAD
jgi:hypothetical protein